MSKFDCIGEERFDGYWPVESRIEQYYNSKKSYKSDLASGAYAAHQATKNVSNPSGSNVNVGSNSDNNSDNDSDNDSDNEASGGEEGLEEEGGTGTVESADGEAENGNIEEEAAPPPKKGPVKRRKQIIGAYYHTSYSLLHFLSLLQLLTSLVRF
jgi:hypothetical protein